MAVCEELIQGKVTVCMGRVVGAQGEMGEKRYVWFMSRWAGPLRTNMQVGKGLHREAQRQQGWQRSLGGARGRERE